MEILSIQIVQARAAFDRPCRTQYMLYLQMFRYAIDAAEFGLPSTT